MTWKNQGRHRLRALALMLVVVFSSPLANAGTLRLDGFDYSLDTVVAPSWNYDTKVLQLGSSALSNCIRAGGGPPSSGIWRIDFVGGAPSIFTNGSIVLSARAPQVAARSVDGDLICSGAMLAPLFSDDFE